MKRTLAIEGKTEQRVRGPLRPTGAAAAFALLLIGTTGCSEADSTKRELHAHLAAATQATTALNALDGPGASLGKYRMFWPKRSRGEMADRIAKVATVLKQKPVQVLSASTIQDQPSKALDDDNLTVSYDAKFDTIRIRDEALAAALVNGSPSDIGEKQAQTTMKAVFKDLVSAGVILDRHYDLADIQTGHHRTRLGADDGSPTREFVVEYRFRLLRKLNGIAVPNNGMTIGIAPTGQRSSIKLGGVEVESAYDGVEERPGQANGIVTRKVSNVDIKTRFDRDVFPGKEKRVTWNKLMYVMPEGAQDALVEPTMVYRFAPIAIANSGEEYPMGAKLYSFSLSDPKRAATDLFPL